MEMRLRQIDSSNLIWTAAQENLTLIVTLSGGVTGVRCYKKRDPLSTSASHTFKFPINYSATTQSASAYQG
jgi:hypothetical protein